jgi:hypothetical protein
VNRSSGPSRVWDLESAEAVANLPREAVSVFLVLTISVELFSLFKVNF